jgi:hypothetical protein
MSFKFITTPQIFGCHDGTRTHVCGVGNHYSIP